MAPSFCPLLLPSVALLLLAPATPTSSGPGSRYAYQYYREPIALDLDRTTLAVKLEGATSVLAWAGASPQGVPGWTRVPVAPGGRTERGVRDLVDRLASEPEVEFVSPVFRDGFGQPVSITREFFVRFQPSVLDSQARAALASSGDVLERDAFQLKGVYRVRSFSKNGFEVLEESNRLARSPGVLWAEPDRIISPVPDLVPDDPSFSAQWGLHNTGQTGGTSDMDLDAPEAWALTRGSPAVRVAILDDGVQQDHPDLHQIPGVTFTGTSTGGAPGNSCDNHGTAVAGGACMAIDNGIGGAGIAGGAYVISLKWTIENMPCNTGVTAQLSWLASALSYCQANGVRVTVLAYGLGVSSLITDSYNSTHAAGVVHFATTGNGAPSPPHYPATLANVNGVGAVDHNGVRASFSQYGPGIDVVGPGVSIFTADRTGSNGYAAGDYVTVNGTSLSTPHAAGVAALVLSACPSCTADEVDAIVRGTAMDLGPAGYDEEYGFGLVNASAAVRAASPGVLRTLLRR